MNEWMNEIFNEFVIQLILVEISFWKEQENYNNIFYLYKVYASIIQGIIIFMNEFD